MNTNRQHKFDIAYCKMAMIWAELSHANRKKVGALIVKDNTIIADGYNGTPSGFENECEEVELNPDGSFKEYKTKWYVLHAETNAIAKIAKSNLSSEGSSLYVTTSPCLECAKILIQCGISSVYFNERYRNLEGVELLLKANVNVFEKDKKSNVFCKYIK